MIADAVRVRFPESKYTVVGCFVFLRLFCVATLAPEKQDFAHDAIPRSRNARKILLQSNRVIQNLSSNILFGSKDSHMVVLNDFLTNNIYKVTTFLREISQLPRTSNSNGNSSGNGKTSGEPQSVLNQHTYDQLHRCLYDNLDRISRDLSGRRTRSFGGYNVTRQPSSVQWKLTLDKLTKLLAELGRPSTLSQEDVTYTKSTYTSRSNHDFGEFMRRNSHRDVSSIRSLNAVYQGGVSRAGNPVFYIIAHLVKPDVDFELLIFHLLSVSNKKKGGGDKADIALTFLSFVLIDHGTLLGQAF